MKAMRAAEFGGPENLRLEDAPEPELRDGHVLIRGQGHRHQPGRPRPHVRPLIHNACPCRIYRARIVAGEVEAVVADISHVAVGDRVFGRSINGGGYAEKACLPGPETIRLPDGRCRLPRARPSRSRSIPPMWRSTIKPSSRLVRPCSSRPAAAGVGVAAVQLAKVCGARVITTVGSADKAAKIQALGADSVINYKTHDFAAEVRRLTGRRRGGGHP